MVAHVAEQGVLHELGVERDLGVRGGLQDHGLHGGRRDGFHDCFRDRAHDALQVLLVVLGRERNKEFVQIFANKKISSF